jgi:hypothetical protein
MPTRGCAPAHSDDRSHGVPVALAGLTLPVVDCGRTQTFMVDPRQCGVGETNMVRMTQDQLESAANSNGEAIVAHLAKVHEETHATQLEWLDVDSIHEETGIALASVKSAMTSLIREGRVTVAKKGKRHFFTVTGEETPIPVEEQRPVAKRAPRRTGDGLPDPRTSKSKKASKSA